MIPWQRASHLTGIYLFTVPHSSQTIYKTINNNDKIIRTCWQLLLKDRVAWPKTCMHSVVLINWFHNKKITNHFWTWWGFFRTSCVLEFWRRGNQCYMYFFLILRRFLYSISNQKHYVHQLSNFPFFWVIYSQ